MTTLTKENTPPVNSGGGLRHVLVKPKAKHVTPTQAATNFELKAPLGMSESKVSKKKMTPKPSSKRKHITPNYAPPMTAMATSPKEEEKWHSPWYEFPPKKAARPTQARPTQARSARPLLDVDAVDAALDTAAVFAMKRGRSSSLTTTKVLEKVGFEFVETKNGTFDQHRNPLDLLKGLLKEKVKALKQEKAKKRTKLAGKRSDTCDAKKNLEDLDKEAKEAAECVLHGDYLWNVADDKASRKAALEEAQEAARKAQDAADEEWMMTEYIGY